MRTTPPKEETKVSVADALPFWTVRSISYALWATSSLERPLPNSSLIAERVATVTAAEEPRPLEEGSWDLT
jgi:hypothetical protein